MSREHHAPVLLDGLNHVPNLSTRDGIHPSRGLIEKDDARLADESNRNRKPPLHASAEASSLIVRLVRKPNFLQALHSFLASIMEWHSLDGSKHLEMLLGRQIVPENVKLRADSHGPTDLCHTRWVGDSLIIYQSFASSRGEDAGEHVDDGGFSSSVWTQEAEELRPLHRKLRTLDCVVDLSREQGPGERLAQASNLDGALLMHRLACPLRDQGLLCLNIVILACF
mmetsp:Transcript_15168/g.38034  ORF Transcript_15168/g.38034 Transcript_15168/m.38034 type:complete len:226 (-) Transcript_15168:2034-2711(-)